MFPNSTTMEPQDLEMPDFTEYTPEVCSLNLFDLVAVNSLFYQEKILNAALLETKKTNVRFLFIKTNV